MPAYPAEDKVGKRYGRLVVVKYAGNSKWLCQCDCGNTKIANTSSLNGGRTQSCGCLHKERASKANMTHGRGGTRLYHVWAGMKERCLNPNATNFKNYGGRGISVCREWADDFATFEAWAIANGYDEGASFGQCTINRIDNDGDYCPENCEWQTISQQARNRRKCRKPGLFHAVEQIDANGNVMRKYPSIRDASEASGISRHTITAVCSGRIKSPSGPRWRYAKCGSSDDEIDKSGNLVVVPEGSAPMLSVGK